MLKDLLKKKWVWLATILVIGGGYFYYQSSKPKIEYTTAPIRKGNLEEYVTATGSVIAPKTYRLSFERPGKISEIPVKVGDRVSKGDVLIKLDGREAAALLAKAKAEEAAAYARLKQVTDGTKAEEIYLAETQLRAREAELARTASSKDADLSQASTDIASAQQSLKDTEAKVVSDLANVYANGLSVLRANISKIEQANAVADRIRIFFLGIGAASHASSIEAEIKLSAASVVKAQGVLIQNPTNDQIELGLREANQAASNTISGLAYARSVAMEDNDYRNKVVASDRTSVESERGYVEVVQTSLTSALSNITAQKSASELSLNNAKSALDAAEKRSLTIDSSGEGTLTRAQSAVAEAQAALRLKRSGARSSDVNLALAQLDSAKAAVTTAELDVERTVLTAPADGIVTDLQVEVGEVREQVSANSVSTAAITLNSSEPLKVEANIAEIDVAKINPGSPVIMTFDAFSQETFKGEVTQIDPAETVVQGVIYYRMESSLSDGVSKVRPGMTANAKLLVGSAADALIAPYAALLRENNQEFVRVLKADGTVEKRQVKLGVQGDIEVQILEGVKEGEQVVTFVKQTP